MLSRLIKDLLGPRRPAAPGGEYYYALMGRIHEALRPRTYVEIGIDDGASLDLVAPATRAIGIDPQPKLRVPLPENVTVFTKTSDAFFAEHDVEAELGGQKIDLAFIDGMHHFEFVLRDFMNLERHCAPGATILVHDCYPLDELTSARERTTGVWTGDVWRALVALREQRPDLAIATVAAPPTGLAIIRSLDPVSSVLQERYKWIVETYMARPYAQIARRKAEALNLVPAEWRVVASLLAT
jgi:methyltransferase family protein